MNRYPVRLAAIVLLALGATAAAAQTPAPAQPTEFRGRLMLGSGPNSQGVVNVKIILDSYSTLEEFQTLQAPLNGGDIERFFSIFKSMKKGQMQFIGGLGLQVVFGIAQELQTEKGLTITLVAESRNLNTGSAKRVSGTALFLVAILELDKDLKGEARIYEDARISILPSGEIKMDSYMTTPRLVASLRKTK